jgi:hypothetical protein
MIDPAIEGHYGTGYERSRLFPGGRPSQEWTDPRRREQILFAARSVETERSLIGFSDHLIAAATKP